MSAFTPTVDEALLGPGLHTGPEHKGAEISLRMGLIVDNVELARLRGRVEHRKHCTALVHRYFTHHGVSVPNNVRLLSMSTEGQEVCCSWYGELNTSGVSLLPKCLFIHIVMADDVVSNKGWVGEGRICAACEGRLEFALPETIQSVRVLLSHPLPCRQTSSPSIAKAWNL